MRLDLSSTSSTSAPTTTGPTQSTTQSSSSSTKPPSTSSSSWCCTAGLDDEDHVQVHRISGYGGDGDDVESGGGGKETDMADTATANNLDLTKSADWMENIEIVEHRDHERGGAGAYDTFRCDYNLTTSKWNIWGLDFHLQRLERSYSSLLQHVNDTTTTRQQDNLLDEEDFIRQKKSMEKAKDDSHKILEALLKEAEHAPILQLVPPQPTSVDKDNSSNSGLIQLLKVTFLWSHSQEGEDESNNDDILVRGHACSSAHAFSIHDPVKPIVCTIAAKGHHIHSGGANNQTTTNSTATTTTIDTSLPSRLADPQNKIASWTKLRKQMERPETYKPPGVSEVLLVRKSNADNNNDDLELLEGISSNVFVIYKDGKLRTAQSGVLNGYVRHLVLECAEACGLELDEENRPILLHDVDLWQEAFITSSSRLIYPISKILLHNDDDENDDGDVNDGTTNKGSVFEEFWRDPVLTEVAGGSKAAPAAADNVHPQDTTTTTPKWQQLLDEILRRGGY